MDDKKKKVIESYNVVANGVKVEVIVAEPEAGFVREYALNIPEYGAGTEALLNDLRARIITEAAIDTEQMFDPRFLKELEGKFRAKAENVLHKQLPKISDMEKQTLIGLLMQSMLGLGKLEFLLGDASLEEIAINTSREPLWVYHRRHGWLKTNIVVDKEADIQNYASIIARRVGKQITILNPLLDAHLITGDRANATLFPISSKGNTLTIRRFRREPWTVTDFIENKTTTPEIMALLWTAFEYELNIIISGGTASGKTSFLNVCMPFLQPNHRLISIEDSVLGGNEMLSEQDGIMRKSTVSDLIDPLIEDYAAEDASIDNETGIKIFSMGKNGKMELTAPSKFIRHKVKKPILEIELASGRSISVTKDHSLFGLGKNGRIASVSGSDLKEGEFIAAPRTLDYEGKETIIDLRDKTHLFEGMFVKSDEIGPLIRKNRDLIKGHYSKSGINWSIKKNTANVKILEIINENVGSGQIMSSFGSCLPMQFAIDEDMACLAGLWLADGCYDRVSVLVSVVEDECREVVRRVAQRHNINVKMHSDDFTLMLNSKLFRTFFEKILELKGDSYTKKFPEWVFGLRKRELAALLRGYFSGDGWVKKDEIATRSSSMQMIKDLQTALLRFGIPLRFKPKRLKDKTYEARISGRKFLKLFGQISFLPRHKKEAFEKLLEGKCHDVSDIVPLPKELYKNLKKALKSDVGKKYTYKGWKGWGGNYKSGNIGRELLRGIVSEHENELKDKEIFKQLVSNDIFWDKITGIKEREFEGFVYDFSVPENESFVCENIIAHNTRELQMPSYLHWVPLTTREPNPEGKGGVTMLDLLVNSLRMRPDRIIVGEVRRQREAEVMFEGMHTGHSVYTTVHADTADETIRRLTNPPISVPVSMLNAVHLNVVMFRNRRLGVRRVLQVAEYIPEKGGSEEEGLIKANVLYRWKATTDTVSKHAESIRFYDEMGLYTGMSKSEVMDEMNTKEQILKWMVNKSVRGIDKVGKLMALYYRDKNEVIKIVNSNRGYEL